jgi:hypothetical protein
MIATVAAVVVTWATPLRPPLDPPALNDFSMADVRQPVAGAYRHVPWPRSYRTTMPAGLPGCAGCPHSPGIHGRATVAATTVPAGRTCSFSKLDILEWRLLGPVVSCQLLQYHDAPTTS